MHQRINLAGSLGFDKLIVAGDSLNVIRCFVEDNAPSKYIVDLMGETKRKLDTFKKIYFDHTLGERKGMTNNLINLDLLKDVL